MAVSPPDDTPARPPMRDRPTCVRHHAHMPPPRARTFARRSPPPARPAPPPPPREHLRPLLMSQCRLLAKMRPAAAAQVMAQVYLRSFGRKAAWLTPRPCHHQPQKQRRRRPSSSPLHHLLQMRPGPCSNRHHRRRLPARNPCPPMLSSQLRCWPGPQCRRRRPTCRPHTTTMPPARKWWSTRPFCR